MGLFELRVKLLELALRVVRSQRSGKLVLLVLVLHVALPMLV